LQVPARAMTISFGRERFDLQLVARAAVALTIPPRIAANDAQRECSPYWHIVRMARLSFAYRDGW
jgi:hypothetical protein